jgi:hypothetical protein
MKTLLAASALFVATATAPVVAEQSAVGATASFHGQALGQGWGAAVSERSQATNSGKAGGDEGPGPGHSESTDPGVGNTAGLGGNNGKEAD